MIYRTAHRTVYRNINENLGLLSFRIAQLTAQAASEKRINSPSDDPAGAARVLGTRSTLSAISQYRTNVAVSDLWLSESGAAAQSVKEVLDNIYRLTEQAATDTYSDSQREAILTEVEGWFQQLLQNGNSKIGDTYIFSGQKVTTQPFAAQVEAMKVQAGCKNSTAWTGKVQNYGSTVFNNRPDLPVHSQNFLIEVVQAGGVDSRWFSTPSKLAGATINGGAVGTGSPMTWEAYSMSLTATDARYNDYQVQFVAGLANQTSTGSPDRNNGLSFSGAALAYVLASAESHTGPVTVNYVLGESSWASAKAAASAAAYKSTYASTYASAYASAYAYAREDPPPGLGLSPASAEAWAKESATNAAERAAALAASAAAAAEPAAMAAYSNGVITVTLLTDGEQPPGSSASAGGVLTALNDLASARGWTEVTSAFSRLPWGDGWISAVTHPQQRPIADWSFLFQLTDSPPNTGQGIVSHGSVTFNDTEIRTEVKNGQVTVYLPRANDPHGQGEFTASISAVTAALNRLTDPATGNRIFSASFTTSFTNSIATSGLTSANIIFQPSPTWTPLATSQPYTLANATLSPRGTQNDLTWAVRNNGNEYVGEAGNELSVQYIVPTDPSFMSPNPKIEFNEDTGLVTVYAAADIGIYHQTFAQVMHDTGDRLTAHERALAAAVITTADDVKAMVNGDPAYASFCTVVKNDGTVKNGADDYTAVVPVSTGLEAQRRISSIFEVSLADGNSGQGRLNYAHPRTFLANGHDQPALFRVSQDGGLTWGPPQSFGASEYQTGDMFHNAFLGHASLTSNIPGKANDLVFTARHQGTWGNDLRVEYKLPDPTTHPNPTTSVTVGPNPWNICVTLRTDAQGRVLSTAKEVMEAVNNHPLASQLVWADLANYHEGGDGVVDQMACLSLKVGEPYEINGRSVITPLGHATATVAFPYTAPSQSDPNIIFQALSQGTEGNNLGVRYTTSADPTFYASASMANNNYQKETTVRYETDPVTNKTVLVVHLGTEELTSCPDETIDPNAAAAWREAFPLYACTETRVVTATAGDVLKAVIDHNTAHPGQAAVWPQFERHPEGWDSTARVGPTNGTIWLTGGESTDSASQHGVNLKFIPDGTALMAGDVFEVAVGWYRGDEKNMDVNLDSSTRGTINTTGSELLGANGAGDNILDTVQRLIHALKRNDTEAIGRELPHVRSAIEKVTTLESKIGTKQIRNQFVNRTLDQKQFSSESLLSAIEDVDFTRLITDLKNAQTVYEALLGITGLITRISLLNYMR